MRRPALLAAIASISVLGTVTSAPRQALAEPPPWWTRDDLATPTTGPLANLWSPTLGEIGGLSLSSAGEGSDAHATGIRMDGPVRTVGGGAGVADLAALDRHPRVQGSHTIHALPATLAATYQLPPQAIPPVVQNSFRHFVNCYDAARRTEPTLSGHVVVEFTIDRVGAVETAADHGSTLPNANVVACVVRGFAALTFPPSADGSAKVVYDLKFEPDMKALQENL
jgi:Ca-activated chloride channel family protein